jgi:hypothetical protein
MLLWSNCRHAAWRAKAAETTVWHRGAAAGNKLFQGTLIGIMSPGASVLQVGGNAHPSHLYLFAIALATLVFD